MAALTDFLNVHKKSSTQNSQKQVKFASMISSTIDTDTSLIDGISGIIDNSLLSSPRKSTNTSKVKGTIPVHDYMDPSKVKNVLVSSVSSDTSTDHTYAKDTVDTSSSDDSSSSSDNESIDVKTMPTPAVGKPVVAQTVSKGRGRPRKTNPETQLPPAPQLKSILKPVTVEQKVTLERVKRRGRGCGNCSGCLKEDCGNCCYCLDKPKFGGPGKKKQRCALRVCANFVSHKNSSSSRGNVIQSKSLTLSSVDTAKLLSDITPSSSTESPLSLSTVKSLSKPQQLLANIAASSNYTAVLSSPNSHAATPTTRTNAKQSGMNGANDDIIKCIICGRERKLSMSRSKMFCSGKCLKDWESLNPGKNADTAESSEINFSLPLYSTVDKPTARVLKNLQIDMALPGERHHDSKQVIDLSDPISNLLTSLDMPSSLIPLSNKRERGYNQESITTPTKKPKPAAPSPVPSPVHMSPPITTTAVVNTKQSYKKEKLNTSEVSSWSIADVVKYFENTGECSHIAPVLHEQEVDGMALLLLSHDSLVKCLGMKLGPALKVMTHVDKLKSQASSSFCQMSWNETRTRSEGHDTR